MPKKPVEKKNASEREKPMDMRSNGENDDDALQRRKLSLLVFWPHVHAGTVYFDRDGELKMSVGEKKNDDDEGEISRKVFFKEYEKTLSKETQMGMLNSNFYHDTGEEEFSILSRFACARVCVSHAKRIDWACEILTNSSFSLSSNTKKKQKKNETMISIQTTTKMMLERIREILVGDDEYYDEEDDDSDDEDDEDATIKLDPMELAMARMSGKRDERNRSTKMMKKKKEKKEKKKVSLRRRVQIINEFDEYIARNGPNGGYANFISYCAFCGYPDGIERAIAYRNRAKILFSSSSLFYRGWRWLERLDDIDRRFDFFTETSPNATNKEEIVLLFRIQLAKFIEAVMILGDEIEAKEQHELTVAAYRRNVMMINKKKKIRVNSLDQLLEGTTYSILADNARRWSTYLYAYATPTVAALKALKRVGEKNEWLEIGAGKGVWARAMRRFGIHITATDAMPEDGNDYHLIEQESSNERNRSIVQKMTHLEAIKKYNHRANGLLVCYCPPDSNMASTSLRAFKGEYVAVIGEDVMNTGDVEMFRILNERFKVLKRVYLPQWMDTVHHLTLFSRKTKRKREKKTKVIQIERCRLCRCDRALFSTVEEHEQEHYLRFLPPVKMCGDELYETVAL